MSDSQPLKEQAIKFPVQVFREKILNDQLEFFERWILYFFCPTNYSQKHKNRTTVLCSMINFLRILRTHFDLTGSSDFFTSEIEQQHVEKVGALFSKRDLISFLMSLQSLPNKL